MNQTVEVEGVIVERNWPLYINIYAVMSQFNINACKPIASIPVFSEKEKINVMNGFKSKISFNSPIMKFNFHVEEHFAYPLPSSMPLELK